jgi:hypothetical protein
LARAFSNKLLEERCSIDAAQIWRVEAVGGYRLRIRFMGIFDTVASRSGR